MGDRGREFKRKWIAGGAEDPQRAATVPQIIRNCLTYRRDSMLCGCVELLTVNYNCKFIHKIPRNLSRNLGQQRRPVADSDMLQSTESETSLLKTDYPQCVIPS